ncbi:sulfatase [Paenibacillus radicis (ex Xue et al. 2023)]|uniref:Sulfatase-like hydrolase/transferase n=1 Tax=Paenibacillus radicis (ex Xue et al. 2023) TaxID=2972489 RepID=A0ABT1YRN8_9BACL|nr:sulfatase-like hydrolase/transferase [Paenibacillus radicis (ex Xue et al. 2023)]MCR8635826.1 sulfatase-like hydrolase/transferase [Paenibacillus radicis (ex Xue et al. 2023)]
MLVVEADTKGRPNIIIIVADDMGYGDPSCYGGWINTPNIDSLAAEGLKFTDFHSSGAVCSPTRAGLLTGRYQQRSGIDGVITAAAHRHLGLQPHEITLSKLLKGEGYATAVFGKWHLGYDTKFNPVRHGFDKFIGYVAGNVDYISHVDQTGCSDWWEGDTLVEEPGYVTHLVTKHSVDFIHEHKHRPFLLYVAHEAPHYPYQGPNDKADRTVGGTFPAYGSREDQKEAYREMVEEMDKGIGDIIEALKQNDLDENTLIIFFSDNGGVPIGSNGPLRGYKNELWEGGHRVPAIVRWSGHIKPGTLCDEPVISIDIMPTVLELCSRDIPHGLRLDGVSIAALLLDSKPVAPRTLFWENGNQHAVREGNWKLVLHAKGLDGGIGLYDLSNDLNEQYNKAEQCPELVSELHQKLNEWIQDVHKDRL